MTNLATEKTERCQEMGNGEGGGMFGFQFIVPRIIVLMCELEISQFSKLLRTAL